MSVIYEALKKAEKGKVEPVFYNPAPKIRNKATLVYFVFVGIAALFIIGIYFQYLSANSYVESVGLKDKRQVASQPSYTNPEETVIPVQEEESSLEYHLQGIVYSESNPFAFINGKKVSRGDVIEEAKVIEISQAGVELETDGGLLELTLE